MNEGIVTEPPRPWSSWPAWHPLFLVAWAALGAAASQLDRLHETAGVIEYPNAEWVGNVLPISPVYIGAGIVAYAVHALLVGVAPGPRGVLGGPRLRVTWTLRAVLSFALAYALTAVASSRALAVGAPRLGAVAPFACGAILALSAAPVLARASRGLVAFAALAGVLGAGFEWTCVAHGAFAYACVGGGKGLFGAPVPLAWLPLLYVHAAIGVHRLLAGQRA